MSGSSSSAKSDGGDGNGNHARADHADVEALRNDIGSLTTLVHQLVERQLASERAGGSGGAAMAMRQPNRDGGPAGWTCSTAEAPRAAPSHPIRRKVWRGSTAEAPRAAPSHPVWRKVWRGLRHQ